jgi:hypothetical protein
VALLFLLALGSMRVVARAWESGRTRKVERRSACRSRIGDRGELAFSIAPARLVEIASRGLGDFQLATDRRIFSIISSSPGGFLLVIERRTRSSDIRARTGSFRRRREEGLGGLLPSPNGDDGSISASGAAPPAKSAQLDFEVSVSTA